MFHSLSIGNMKVHGIVTPLPSEYKHKEGMVQFIFKYANYLVPRTALVAEPEYHNPDLMNELKAFPVRSGFLIYNPQ